MTVELAPSSVFAKRYRVTRNVGSGGFGSVYESTHVVTGRPCALKVLLPHLAKDDEFRERFLQESRVTAQIRGEHIVDVLDAGIDEDTDTPFIVMELLKGEDLARRLKRKRRFSIAETVIYLSQVALALEHAHRRAIIHRDLKPANLFLTSRPDGAPLIKILDFGIAKILADQTAKGATQSLGTPLYMAPEQFRRARASPGVDVYALGMLAFIFLVGEHYFARERRAAENPIALALVLADGAKDAARVRAREYGVDLPPGFDAWFARTTHRDPEQRTASARAAAVELAEALGVEVPPALLASGRVQMVGAFSNFVDSLEPQPPVGTVPMMPVAAKRVTLGSATIPASAPPEAPYSVEPRPLPNTTLAMDPASVAPAKAVPGAVANRPTVLSAVDETLNTAGAMTVGGASSPPTQPLPTQHMMEEDPSRGPSLRPVVSPARSPLAAIAVAGFALALLALATAAGFALSRTAAPTAALARLPVPALPSTQPSDRKSPVAESKPASTRAAESAAPPSPPDPAPAPAAKPQRPSKLAAPDTNSAGTAESPTPKGTGSTPESLYSRE